MYFKIDEPLNREVSLYKDDWQHVQDRHPEFKTWYPLEITVKNPNVIVSSQRKADRDIYYRLGALKTYPKLYVAVVVGFTGNDGRIVTAHLSDEIKGGSGGYKYVSKI